MGDGLSELSAVVGTGNQRGLGAGILWKASVLDLSHPVMESMTRGCGRGSKSKWDGSAGSAHTDPGSCKGSCRRADFTGQLGKNSALCWTREGINPCTWRRKSICVCMYTHVHVCISKSTQQRVIA